MNEWFEVFKIGEHTDSAGNKKSWTEQDLDNIVAKYNEQNDHEAPLVIGHPKSNDPAYGWVESLKRVGDRLLAKPKQVVKEFADAVKDGLYKKRSISLYPDGTLRHIGFLGAVPPAIKGLKDLAFNDADKNPITIELEFEEAKDIDSLKLEIDALKSQITEKKALENQLTEYKEKTTKLTKDFEDAVANRLEAEQKLSSLYLKQRKLEYEQFLNEKLAYGNLTPAQADAIKSLLTSLEAVQEFSEGSKDTIIEQVFSSFKEFVNTLPVQIPNPPSTADKNNQSDPTEFSEPVKVAERMAALVNNKVINNQ